ncbi:MAG: ABC transporter permease [Actinomycetia bacterium]|nr:ABC transporter permease [Actinomycetes bacterium]
MNDTSVSQLSTNLPTPSTEAAEQRSLLDWLEYGFVRVGVLPPLLIIAIIVFSRMSSNFLAVDNFENVVRQNTFLIIVALGQMLVLLTGGFDLSVGAGTALVSVLTATVMASIYDDGTGSVGFAIALGITVGVLAGGGIGLVNGIGVSVFRVSPFIMTLGTSSIAVGLALYTTSGVPVRGMPPRFSDIFGFGEWGGLATPIWITGAVVVIVSVVLNWTRLGRYLYAIGGNANAATLSGVTVRTNLTAAYVMAGLLMGLSSVLLTGRLETGEANIGTNLPLQSIAACVIGGVSLRGGIGRVSNVVLGALFIGIVQNGMNLARIQSFMQMIVLGSLLIIAVIADQFRQRSLSRLAATGVLG